MTAPLNTTTAGTAPLPQARPAAQAAPAQATAPAAPETSTPAASDEDATTASGANSSQELPTSESLPTSPSGNDWSYGDDPIQGNDWYSVGDPHEKTGDGAKFDNMRRGEFVKLKSASGDFQVQTTQEPWANNPGATVNTKAAVKMGDDLVTYDGNNGTLSINGEAKTLKTGEKIDLPGGGSVEGYEEGGVPGYRMTSPQGDVVNVRDQGNYLDLTGQVSPSRKDGEVRGSLGNMDADTDAANDMVGRDGQPIGDLEAFLDEWTVQDGESLFGEQPQAGAEPNLDEEFKQVDKNADGVLSGNELDDHFKLMDKDEDGRVTTDEFKTALGQKGEEQPAEKPALTEADREAMKQLDINEDGWLSGTEMKGLEAYDTDGDGEISEEEFAAGRQQGEAPAPEQEAAEAEGAGGGGVPETEEDEEEQEAQTAEAAAAKKAFFAKADRNADGNLDEEEAEFYAFLLEREKRNQAAAV